MLEWVRKYAEHLNQEWKTIIYLVGKFSRSKSIRKDQGGRRHTAITLHENKVYLYDSYVEHLIHKTPKLELNNVVSFLRAFVSASRDETNETGSSFCL
jgi:hypothetical protein